MSCSKEFPEYMRPKGRATFTIERRFDESGVSGTGQVLEGVVFSDGSVAIHWFSEYQSHTIFPDLDTFLHVHVFMHPANKTHIVMEGLEGITATSWNHESPEEVNVL